MDEQSIGEEAAESDYLVRSGVSRHRSECSQVLVFRKHNLRQRMACGTYWCSMLEWPVA